MLFECAYPERWKPHIKGFATLVCVRPLLVKPTWWSRSHLLDGGMDLYGLHLEVAFVARLREERRFNGVDELRAQIATDVDHARDLLSAGVRPDSKG